MSDQENFQRLILAYKQDQESVYNTWFVSSEERLKAFRAIRRGVERVITEIKQGTFGTDFKGSSLEVVLTAITEQKQVFMGAAHPFYWKPKLRIPDIYESEPNKLAFGQFLEACLSATREDQILREITRLAERKIKGLGPAVANILYFLHPTLIPPFNTAMLEGFNLLFQEKKKLGSWESYLEMREMILEANASFRNLLSNDLGAISGLLFDVGVGKIVVEGSEHLVLDKERQRALATQAKRHREVQAELDEEHSHTKIQHLLLKAGRALGYDVIAAVNDRNKAWQGEKLSFNSLAKLPPIATDEEVLRTIELIDVLWFEKGSTNVVCAFEVEKSTSIYSGILRLSDLSMTFAERPIMICLVAPDQREKEVIAQLRRPSLAPGKDLQIHYMLFSDLCEHCEAICKFGDDFTILKKITRNSGSLGIKQPGNKTSKGL